MSRLSTAAAIAFVLLVYTFFGSIGTMSFPRVRWDQGFGKPADGYYASLSEGFLRGQVSMAHRADPRLAALPDPYDFESRKDIPYLWDASYFEGRYYLYFSPLPALLFHLPFRLIAGMYPNDQLAGTLFAAWAFLMAAAFVRRAVPHTRSILLVALGLASVAPFVLPHCRTYEVAILCGAAMTSTWAYATLRFIETQSAKWLVGSSLWLALAIAARPNLGVLLAVMLFLPGLRRKHVLLALIPLTLVAASLLAYNHARFRDPFEFGHRYQLTYMSMEDKHVCGVRNASEVRRAIDNVWLYLVTPPRFQRAFPFVDLGTRPLDPAVSFTPQSDQIGGLIPLAPLAIMGSLLALRRRNNLILAGGWLVLLGVSTCWYVSARYALDFWFLISAGAIVAIERERFAPIPIAIVAVASSLLGAMLGFSATSGAFRYFNPELFGQLSRLFE